MKKLQNKIWAKIIAFVLCLLGVYGLIVNGIFFYLVNEVPKEEQALKNSYEQIVSHYSYEIFEEMMCDSSSEHVEELLEKYKEKNWTFGIVETKKQRVSIVTIQRILHILVKEIAYVILISM